MLVWGRMWGRVCRPTRSPPVTRRVTMLTIWGERSLESPTPEPSNLPCPPTKRKHEPGLGSWAAKNQALAVDFIVWCDGIARPAATRPDRTALTRGGSVEAPAEASTGTRRWKGERACIEPHAGAGLSLRPGNADQIPRNEGERKKTCGISLKPPSDAQ